MRDGQAIPETLPPTALSSKAGVKEALKGTPGLAPLATNTLNLKGLNLGLDFWKFNPSTGLL
jgi:hypothetical protein